MRKINTNHRSEKRFLSVSFSASPTTILPTTILLLFILLILPPSSPTEDMFFFDPSPMSQDVLEGGDVVLRCDVSNRALISFYWTYNNKPLQSAGRRLQEDSNLRIKRVDRSLDSGSFRCVASNVTAGNAIRSAVARLNIIWISDKAEIQSKQFKDFRLSGVDDDTALVVMMMMTGSEMSMKCQVEGNPEPMVEWFVNEARIQPSEGIRLHKTRLKMQRFRARDSGVYRCEGSNQAGSRSSVNRVLMMVQKTSSLHHSPTLNTQSFTVHAVVKASSTATLHCQFEHVNRVEWSFRGQLINSNSYKHVILANDSLVIRHVDLDDAGAYKCVGVAVQSVAYTSQLDLAYIEEMDSETFKPYRADEAVVVKRGGVVDVPCKPPPGLPTPRKRWIKRPYIFQKSNAIYKSDDVIRNDDGDDDDDVDDDVIMTSDGRLTLNNVDVTHTGSYICVAENTAGFRNRSVDVIVTVPPVIHRSPISIRVTEGESASFDCLTASTPYPFTRISWLFDDEPIQMASKDIEYDEDNGAMYLRKVRLKDQGSYACVLNTTGQAIAISNNAHLYVEKRLKFWPELTDTKLELGKEGQLFCRAVGKTRPKMRWSREGGLQSHVSDRDGLLVFGRVRKEDGGEYTCTATNEQETINSTINLTVYEKASFKVRPEGNVTGVEGRSMMVHCFAGGNPQPSVSWFKNTVPMQPASSDGRIKIFRNGTLVIKEVYMEDVGEYVCVAENVGGRERATVYLKVFTIDTYNQLISEEKILSGGDSHMIKTVAISLACGAIYLAFVIGLTVYCTIRITKAKQLKKNNKNGVMIGNGGDMSQAANESAGLVPRKELEISSSISTSSYNTRTHPDDYNTLASVRGTSHLNLFSPLLHQTILPHTSPDKLYISRYKIQILGLLGQSQYGDVFLGKTTSNVYKNNSLGNDIVMVKSFLMKSESAAEQCLREIDLFGRCEHKNVVKLVGLCVELEPLFVVLENTEWGDLKKFLLASRDGLLPRLSSHQLSALCSQVALGMEHLYNLGLVHKDLSARNIIVNAALLEAKISYPTLCRDVYASDYFILSGRLIPLRWMAPEAILDSCETRESDAYSYGVLVWEVYSLGEIPLSSKTNEQILEGLNSNENQLSFPVCPIPHNKTNVYNDYNNYKINSGNFRTHSSSIKSFSINQLSDCPENMWRLIQGCTVLNPRLRPRFPDIVLSLYDLTYETVNPRIDNER